MRQICPISTLRARMTSNMWVFNIRSTVVVPLEFYRICAAQKREKEQHILYLCPHDPIAIETAGRGDDFGGRFSHPKAISCTPEKVDILEEGDRADRADFLVLISSDQQTLVTE